MAPIRPSLAPDRASPFGGKALVLAWAIEIVAVLMGLLLAVYAGIEGGTSGLVGTVIATLPFIALTATELTKIPLVGLCFGVRNPLWKLLAVAALIVVTVATFENFVFGFERGFTERIAQVAEADLAARQAEGVRDRAATRLPGLEARQAELTARLATLREEMAAIREQAQQDIRDTREAGSTASDLRAERERLDRDLAALETRRVAEVERERRRCQQPEVRCNIGAIEAGYRRQREELLRRQAELLGQMTAVRDRADGLAAAARQRRDAELDAKERERAVHQTALDAVRAEIIAAQDAVQAGGAEAERAARARDELVARSQMHRLASVIYGNHETEAVDATKKLFIVSLSAIVALIGSLIATLHYAALGARLPRRRPLANAVRGYFARKRRRLPVSAAAVRRVGSFGKLARALRLFLMHRRRRVEVREVERPVDRLKLVYVPMNASEDDIADIRRSHGLTPAGSPHADERHLSVVGA